MPVEADPWQPSQRPPPWDSGWGPRRGTQLLPMMRSRQQIGGTIVGPSYQYAANQLVYSHSEDWH
eukprot:2820201-Lingulodinium_polyedra.AAC.1